MYQDAADVLCVQQRSAGHSPKGCQWGNGFINHRSTHSLDSDAVVAKTRKVHVHCHVLSMLLSGVSKCRANAVP